MKKTKIIRLVLITAALSGYNKYSNGNENVMPKLVSGGESVLKYWDRSFTGTENYGETDDLRAFWENHFIPCSLDLTAVRGGFGMSGDSARS